MKQKIKEYDVFPPQEDDWFFDYDLYKSNNHDVDEVQNEHSEESKDSEENNSITRLPINSSKQNMRNKQCNYKALSIITLYSAANYDKNTRYSYKTSLFEHKEEIENLSKMKLDTIFRHIKKICKFDNDLIKPINAKDNIAYLMKYSSGKNDRGEYVVIEKDIIKCLVENCSSEEIKAYIFLKYRCEYNKDKDKDKDNTKREAMVSNDSICENIGLSKKSHDNISKVTKITNKLVELNLIKKKTVTKVRAIEGKEKCTYRNIYSIVSYEDFNATES